MSNNQKEINSQDEIKNTENSKILLNRKTKRENNNLGELKNDPQILLKNSLKCSICLEYEIFSSKCYKCINCLSYFHIECYNLFNFSEEEADKIKNNNLNNFVCPRCVDEKRFGLNFSISCYLCGEHGGIIKKFRDNQYTHHYCYVFFRNKLHQIKNGKCNFCKIKNIPLLKCEFLGCKEKYHIKCALEKGLIFSLSYMKEKNNEENKKESFNEKIKFLCETHNKNLIDNYAQYITDMIQSMNDKNIKLGNKNNNLINETQNINNVNETIILNKEKNNINYEKIIINNEQKIEINDDKINKEENEKNKSIGSNSDNDDNYGSNNNSMDDSEKTPVNNYFINKTNSENDKNPILSNNIVLSGNNKKNNNNNKGTINVTVIKNNLQENKKNENDYINNNDDDDEDIADINMIIEEDDKNNNDKKSQININLNRNEEEENNIIITNQKEKDKENFESKNENKEKEKYKIPEIKHEPIDLFENFKKMNEDYCFPGSFYKFHSI